METCIKTVSKLWGKGSSKTIAKLSRVPQRRFIKTAAKQRRTMGEKAKKR
jgi:hypothetical protein